MSVGAATPGSNASAPARSDACPPVRWKPVGLPSVSTVARRVHRGVDLGARPAPAPPDRLVAAPLSPPAPRANPQPPPPPPHRNEGPPHTPFGGPRGGKGAAPQAGNRPQRADGRATHGCPAEKKRGCFSPAMIDWIHTSNYD